MRSLCGGLRWRSSSAHAIAVAGTLACVAPACRPDFTGPYPCAKGFTSCTNPQANMCETDLTSDALNCGACGTGCGLGAACVGSVCGTAAVELAMLGQQPSNQQSTLGVNSTAVFWYDNQNGQLGVFSVPIAGGSPTTVATNLSCQGAQAFAVDDNNLYYWSIGNGMGLGLGGGNGAGLYELPLVGGMPTMLSPEPPGNCPATAVDASNVYWLAPSAQGGAQTVAYVPIAGGATTTLATSSYSSTQLIITPADAIVQVPGNNGPPSYAAIPIAGGPPVPVFASGNLGGGSAFTADARNIYAVGSSCPCGGNGPSYNGPPTGQVVMLPIDGGAPSILAQVTGQASSIAVDSSNVYFSTDTAVWKVPIAGGPVSSVAGSLTTASNLAAGTPGYQCAGGCGGSPVGLPNVIAVDATSVYIADFAPNVNAILKVPK